MAASGPDDVLDEEQDEDKEVLPEGNRSILLGMMSQLKNGMDLSRVTLPTFVLEPRSFLERLTDFFTHPHALLDVCDQPDPVQRMLSVVRWHLSGWHIRPAGVRKPYNPILGESFRSEWDHGSQGRSFFIAEQLSHHPPMSGYYLTNRARNIVVDGYLLPRSKFLMNAAASILEGRTLLRILNLDEEYELTFPSYYARGILIGTLKMELSGHCKVVCKKTGLICEMEFKNKGFFRGEHNSVVGKVRYESSKDILYSLDGRWDKQIRVCEGTKGDKKVFFDVRAEQCPKIVPPEEDQSEWESRRLWAKVTRALRAGDLDTATAEKTFLEENQREGERERKERDEVFEPKFFEPGETPNSWKFKKPDLTPYRGADAPEEQEFPAAWARLTSAGIFGHPEGPAGAANGAADATPSAGP